jgi:hypothetical protein
MDSSFWHVISNTPQHMIRITTQKEKNGTVVTIDGQVVESDLREIRRVRESVTGAVVLNLRGLDTCAVGGVRILRDWLGAGARLQSATPFLEMLLKEPSP